MTQTGNCHQPGVLTQRCQEAVQAIQNVLDTPPAERHQIVDFGECAIVALRDCLIALLREAGEDRTGEERQHLRLSLDQVNIALSLITGVEYPGAGIQEQSLKQADAVLRGLTL